MDIFCVAVFNNSDTDNGFKKGLRKYVKWYGYQPSCVVGKLCHWTFFYSKSSIKWPKILYENVN